MHDHSERVDLRADALVASWLPACGMLGVSLRDTGTDREFIARPRTLDEYRAGGSTAVPLLHPWANRLRSHTYRVGTREVELTGLGVPTDANGLPIHGLLQGRPFTVQSCTSDTVVASYTADDAVLAAFPFPHTVTVTAVCRRGEAGGLGTLTVTTEIDNTGTDALPISFGWHPFFTLPGTPRAQWRLRTPPCAQHELTETLLPTGRTHELPEIDEPVGDRTYDDHFTLGTDRRFVVADAQHVLTIEFDEHFPAAQIYLPPSDGPTLRGEFVCIEPMTAATDAINTGSAPLLAPGDRFRAEWSVTVERR